MLSIRRAEERGHANHGWLDTHHTFSFADYYDPRHMGFRALRVINDDVIAAGKGFGTHPHQDMEIVTYVLSGRLAHKDSMGTSSVIQPGEVQRMSAGTGVRHSEYNDSQTDPVHLLQIWLLPNQRGLAPSYEQKTFAADDKRQKLRLVASPNGREGSVRIHSDANIYATLLDRGEQVEHQVGAGRGVWLHVAQGSVKVNGHNLVAGDAASTEDADKLVIEGVEDAEVLLFDLA